MASVVIVGACLVGVAGCEEHFDRRDTLSHVAGDAIAVNKATQTIHRWPKVAGDERWKTDGERSRLNIEKYRARTNGEDFDQKATKQTSATGAN